MSWIGHLEELASVGLTPADIERAVGESPAVRAEVIRMAELAAKTWQEIWDGEGPHPEQTGAYRESFTITYDTKPSGEFSATVRTKRPNAHWLEYGTSKMAEFAPARKTIERLNGQQSGHSSRKDSGGDVGSVS
ncbi:HK97 gp10 family phage protein [Mycolicibacterium hodleri]|uniref:HK97 gp10 family phage protein n=1 Tax=Mycolicibacterium hodleri TaxID=49897 RepID=A0A502E5K4_9MYCO|nr:HK97 gp10 family phage protein [Mycolicibacterium hodleri]TPG31751.1 HK97 gp10 family phage protein [Mycolicibacterium hodleri]